MFLTCGRTQKKYFEPKAILLEAIRTYVTSIETSYVRGPRNGGFICICTTKKQSTLRNIPYLGQAFRVLYPLLRPAAAVLLHLFYHHRLPRGNPAALSAGSAPAVKHRDVLEVGVGGGHHGLPRLGRLGGGEEGLVLGPGLHHLEQQNEPPRTRGPMNRMGGGGECIQVISSAMTCLLCPEKASVLSQICRTCSHANFWARSDPAEVDMVYKYIFRYGIWYKRATTPFVFVIRAGSVDLVIRAGRQWNLSIGDIYHDLSDETQSVTRSNKSVYRDTTAVAWPRKTSSTVGPLRQSPTPTR